MGRLKQEAKDAYKTKRRNYEIPELERRARSQGAGKSIPGITETTIERKISDKKQAVKHKEILANKSRPYWTGEGGNGVRKGTPVPGYAVPVGGTFQEIWKKEEALKEAYRKALSKDKVSKKK